MKRKALLIGNTAGLKGVQLDLERFSNFLRSNVGGAWYSSEIEIAEDVTKVALQKKLSALKNQTLDYCIVLFSGHAGWKRQTILEINGQGDLIAENDLKNIAIRQLNIYDCCRVAMERTMAKVAMDSAILSESSQERTRQKYEARIMDAIPQQVSLYACSIGQSSYDTANGAVYLSHLLSAAKTFDRSSSFKLVGIAHQEASLLTRKEHDNQIPDAFLPKCLSSQQLIIAINP